MYESVHFLTSYPLFVSLARHNTIIIKYHRLGILNSRNLFSHSSGDLKSKIKVPAGWFLVRPPPWVIDRHLLAVSSHVLCVCVCVCVCVCSERRSSLVSCSSSYKDTRPIGLGTHTYDLINITLITSLKSLSPNTVTLDNRISTYELKGDTIQPIMHTKQDIFNPLNLCT